MVFLNPVIALASYLTGLIVLENIIRLLRRQNIFWTLAVIKFTVTALFLLPGWVPDWCPVNAPFDSEKTDINPKLLHPKHADSGYVKDPFSGDTNHIKTEPEWILAYRYHVLLAFIAGVLLCLVSHYSHWLSGPGMIAHEAISQFFAFLFTVCLFAIFAIYHVFLKGKYVRFVGQSE